MRQRRIISRSSVEEELIIAMSVIQKLAPQKLCGLPLPRTCTMASPHFALPARSGKRTGQAMTEVGAPVATVAPEEDDL